MTQTRDGPGASALGIFAVVAIDGQAIPAPVRPVLIFERAGQILGSTGCNRYSALARIQGERLRFFRPSWTARACAGDGGRAENTFLRATADDRQGFRVTPTSRGVVMIGRAATLDLERIEPARGS